MLRATPSLADRQLRLRRVTMFFMIIVSLLFCVKLAQALPQSAQTQETDLGAYFDGVLRLRSGLPLYDPQMNLDVKKLQFIYPPLLALLLLPLPTYIAAWWTWTGLSIMCWAVAVGLVLRELRASLRDRLPPAWRPVVVAALINFPPLLAHLLWGQLQLVLLLLLVGSWLGLRRNQQVLPGLLLGIAIVLKVFPLVLLVPLVVTRRWRAVSTAVITAGVLLALSFAWVGWDQVGVYLFKVLPEVERARNHGRLDSSSITTLVQQSVTMPAYADLVTRAISVGLVGSLAVLGVRRKTRPDHLWTLGITTMVLVTPTVYAHYFVLLYLPWLDSLAQAGRGRLGLLGLAYFLIATASLVFYVQATALVFVAQMLPVIGALGLWSIQVASVGRAYQPAANGALAGTVGEVVHG